MSRLKKRPAMPTLMDILNQETTRMEGQEDKTAQSLKEKMTVAVPEKEMMLADAAFCRQCGHWLSSDYISLGIKFRCPECDYTLFTINRIGARGKWEKNYEQATEEKTG